jgi:hypothetical protein
MTDYFIRRIYKMALPMSWCLTPLASRLPRQKPLPPAPATMTIVTFMMVLGMLVLTSIVRFIPFLFYLTLLTKFHADCYYGGWKNFPPSSEWVEFDAMWNYSKSAMSTSCSDLGVGSCSNGAGAFGAGDTGQQIGLIWNAIQQVAESSLVDHRFILATILQEVSFVAYESDPRSGDITLILFYIVLWLCQCLCINESRPLATRQSRFDAIRWRCYFHWQFS